MKIKKKFELVESRTGYVYNIVPLKRGTLKAYEVGKDDYEYLIGLAKTFGRTRGHPTSKIIENHLKNCVIVNLDIYPLPGFVTKTGEGVINLNVLPGKLVTDYNTSDVFSIFLYTIALRTFIVKKAFTPNIESNIAGMFFSMFMKLFGKRAGLIGAYDYLIPKLNFLIWIYAHSGMLGLPLTSTAKAKIASGLMVGYSDLNLDYDFSSITEWFKCINENKILSISRKKFSSLVINIGGTNSLPIFEDVSRFYATFLASTVPGNTQFTKFWAKTNVPLFNKIVEIALFTLKKRLR